MKEITNDFLNEIIFFEGHMIGFERKQVTEFVRQDQIMQQNAERFAFSNLDAVKPIREMEEESIDNTYWQGWLFEVVRRVYFAKILKENKSNLQKQLDNAKSIRESDICKREVRIAEYVDLEIEILTRVLRIKPVRYVINAFYYLATKIYPDLSEKQKCVIVSEIMNGINLYTNKPFQTLEEASQQAEKNLLTPPDGGKLNEYNIDGATIIYSRIKKEIEKKFVLKPLSPEREKYP